MGWPEQMVKMQLERVHQTDVMVTSLGCQGSILPKEIFIFGPSEMPRNTSKTARVKTFMNLY